MFEDVRMLLDICIECGKEIIVDERRILIYKDKFHEYWVHTGECLENYKKLLTSPEAIKQGAIIGMCDICAKPVRSKQRYTIVRSGWKGMNFGKGHPFYTTFPSSENSPPVTFNHNKCANEAYGP